MKTEDTNIYKRNICHNCKSSKFYLTCPRSLSKMLQYSPKLHLVTHVQMTRQK